MVLQLQQDRKLKMTIITLKYSWAPSCTCHARYFLFRHLLRTHTSGVQIRTMETSQFVLYVRAVYIAVTQTKANVPSNRRLVRCWEHQLWKGLLINLLNEFFEKDLKAAHHISHLQSLVQKWISWWTLVRSIRLWHGTSKCIAGIDPDKYKGFAFGLGVEQCCVMASMTYVCSIKMMCTPICLTFFQD